MNLLSAEPNPVPALQINAPELFQDAAFLEWLNNPKTIVFTWHPKGESPDEWSDVIVGIDPSLNGEGSDSDMPEHCWDALVDLCRDCLSPSNGYHVLVRLTNYSDS